MLQVGQWLLVPRACPGVVKCHLPRRCQRAQFGFAAISEMDQCGASVSEAISTQG